MFVLVTYDICVADTAGQRRLRKISRECTAYGVRVQKSVFECRIDPAQWEKFSKKLIDIYKPEEDSLRFYFLGSNWERRIEHHGQEMSPDVDQEIII